MARASRKRLAVNGGSPVRAEPFPPRVQIGEEEVAAVNAAMDRCRAEGGAFDRYGGIEVDAYEREFAAAYGVKFATAVSSGTAAIHTALGALRLDVGQEVISAPITDPGAVWPILWLNLIPVFADADPRTMNVSARSIEQRITDKTKAVIVAHIAGQPCNMDAIMKVVEKHDLVLIEDCAQAHGARYKGRPVGSFGHLAAFSLMSGKHTTSGGQGGMVLTDDEDLYWNAKRFADRGKPFNSDAGDNLFLGMNYRMTELQAAIGRVQLRKTEAIARRRRALVNKLRKAMVDLKGVRLAHQITGAWSVYWFLLIHFEGSLYRVDKATFVEALAAEGIPCEADYSRPYDSRDVIVNRRTYGRSGCPWTCPFYGRHIDYAATVPNAHRAVAEHFVVYFHECWTDREIADLVAALAKVESAYIKRSRRRQTGKRRQDEGGSPGTPRVRARARSGPSKFPSAP